METKATGKKKKVYTVPMQRCRQTPEMEDCFARTRAGNCSALVDTEYPCGDCPFYKPPDQLEEEQKRTYERLIRIERVDLIELYEVEH